MGWLFAVALGLRSAAAAVLKALPPIALGHAPPSPPSPPSWAWHSSSCRCTSLKWVFAALLVGFGLFKLAGTRHPRWVGMRVGFGT